jgi:hypothetical protein
VLNHSSRVLEILLAVTSLLLREMRMMKSMGDIIKVEINREMRTSLKREICYGLKVCTNYIEKERLIRDWLEVIANY